MMRIALIAPCTISGGVATVLDSLYKGLVSEGFYVDIIKLGSKNFPLPSIVYDDIMMNSKRLKKYDILLYIGSIPWPGHIIAKLREAAVTLFVHGFVYSEFFNTILHESSLKSKIGPCAFVSMFMTGKILNTVDLYICHTVTACEANKIFDRFVLLPQWIFPETLYFHEPKTRYNSIVRIVAYSSYHNSPRLLSTYDLIALAHIIEHMTNRPFELIIISPRQNMDGYSKHVRIIKTMPQKEFLPFLASADLYIERCIDEELGLASLESMMLGTPVAKLTYPKYWGRQDYTSKELLLASSFKELARKIAEYINNIDFYYSYYSRRGREFVLRKRTWNAVKDPFLRALKNIYYYKQ